MRFWDRGPALVTIATATQLGLVGASLPLDAVYYNNAFWFVRNTLDTGVTRQTLVQVKLNYDAAGRPSFASRTQYEFSLRDAAGALVPIYDGFGDIAMDPSGRLYLASSATSGNNGAFYTLNTADLTTAGPNNALVLKKPSSGNPTLQLSFSCDFKTLWGQDLNTCNWWVVPHMGGDTATDARAVTVPEHSYSWLGGQPEPLYLNAPFRAPPCPSFQVHD
jgi:hypothetical protein